MSEWTQTFSPDKSRTWEFFPKLSSPVASVGAALALAVVCFSVWIAAASSLSLAVAAVVSVAIIPAVIIGCSTLGSRPFAVFGLVFSIPFSVMHHLVYRPNTGAADGITVQLIDIWMVWLLIHYAYQHHHGNTRRLYGIAAFCFPLVLLLVADFLSLFNSADIQLSVYGILNHLRAAVLFFVLAVTLAQGKNELRAAYLGIVCAVSTIGSICIGEMILQANIRSSLLSNSSDSSIFRAGGMEGPTGAAAYLVALLPIVAIEYFYPISRFRRALAGAGLCVGLAGLGCTLTRSAIGILVVGFIPLLIFFRRRRLIRARHMVLCLIGLGLLWANLGTKLGARLDENTSTLNGRVPLMGTALNMTSSSPLIGVGINNYALKMDAFIPVGQRQDFEYLVHNKFLLTIAETGSLGCGALIWLLAMALRRSFLLARRGLPMGIGLFSSIIIVVLDMNVESYEGGAILLNAWILIAIIAALWSCQHGTSRRSAVDLDGKAVDPVRGQES